MPKIRNRRGCVYRENKSRWQEEAVRPRDEQDIADQPAYVFKDSDKEELRRVLHKQDLEDVPPTVMAVALGRFDVLKILLKKGCSIDATDEEENTACVWAARLGNRQMVELLLARGANPAASNKKGDDVLSTAAQSPEWCETAFLDLLAVVGDTYDVACSNADGWTALHYAVKKQWRAAVRWLLEAGAAVDAATRRGVSPLMLAASTGHHAILQALVAARAAIFLEDERGCTAFCYAIAFMMRKRLNEPSHSVLVMSCAIRGDETSVSMDSYLERRMELLSKPPECVADFASIISSVISLVLVFFAKFVQGGYELLLETRVFHNITQALLRHVDDAAFTLALLSLLLELLKMLGHCSGLTGGRLATADVANCFVRERAADACLSVLKRYNENTGSSDEVQRAAMMPLILTCATKSIARVWLQDNHKIVRTFYKYEDWFHQNSKYTIDSDSLDLFLRKCQSFNNLMTNLKNGLNIVLSGRHKKKFKTTSAKHLVYKDRASRPRTKMFKLKLLNENNSASDMYSSTDYASLTPPEGNCPNKHFEEQTTGNKFSSPSSQTNKREMPYSHKNNTLQKRIKFENIPVREVDLTHSVLGRSGISKHENEVAVDGTAAHNSYNTENYKNISETKNPANIWSLKTEHHLDFTQQNPVNKTVSRDKIPLNKSQGIKNILGGTYHIGEKILETCEKTPLTNQLQFETGRKPSSRVFPCNTKQLEAIYTNYPDYDNLMSCLEYSRNEILDESLTPDLRALNFLFNNLINKYVLCWQHVSGNALTVDVNHILHVSEYKNFCYLIRVWESTSSFLEEIKDTEVFNKKTLNIRYTILRIDKALDRKIKLTERNAADKTQRVISNEVNTCPYIKETVPKAFKQDNLKTEEDILEECNQVVISVINFLNLDDTSDFTSESSGDYEFLFNDRSSERTAHSEVYHNEQQNVDSQSKNVTRQELFLEECIDKYIGSDDIISAHEQVLSDKSTSVNCESKTSGKYYNGLYEKPGDLLKNCELESRMDSKTCINAQIKRDAGEKREFAYHHSNTVTDSSKPSQEMCAETSPDASNADIGKESPKYHSSYEDEVRNVASLKASQNSTTLVNGKNSAVTPGTSSISETATGEAQHVKLYLDSMKHHSSSATSANCRSPKKQDANNSTENQKLHSKTTSVDFETISQQCRKKLTIAERLFHLAVRPQTAQRLVVETCPQAGAQARKEQPDEKSSDVPEPTENNYNIVPYLKTCSASKWHYLVRAFAALSPKLVVSLSEGKAVVARRQMRANFKVAASLELGLAADGTLLALRRWRCGVSRHMDDALLSAVTPLLGLARHANLLPYLLAERHDGELFVAAPLCEANLEQHVSQLRSSGTLHSVGKVIAWQIMRGLQFLHSLSPPVVHGNLKPSNVLVDAAGVIRLADFGLGPVMWQLGCNADQSAVVWWPPEYLAPCGLRRPPLVTTKGDVFSAGLLMNYAITGGLHPFGSTRHQILCNVARSNPCFKSSEPDLAHLLAALFATRPFDRPYVRDVLRHVFFWDKTKRWNFLLACAGVNPQVKTPEKSLVHLYQFIDSTAAAHNVTEDWVGIVKATFPEAAREPPTLSALLRFVRWCAEERGRQPGTAQLQLGRYFLAAFPNLPLKLFRLLDGTCHATRPDLARFFAGPDVAWR